MNNEVSYQTTGISADRSGGGVTVNMIPREGGNRFSGDAKLNYRPSSWIGNNVGCDTLYTASCKGQDSSVHSRLNAMGLNSSSSLRFLEDETISEGGPIVKNKLWFFGSFHQFRTSDLRLQLLLRRRRAGDRRSAHPAGLGPVDVSADASRRRSPATTTERRSWTRASSTASTTPKRRAGRSPHPTTRPATSRSRTRSRAGCCSRAAIR